MLLKYNTCVILIIIHTARSNRVMLLKCMCNINYNTHSQVKWVILLKYYMCNIIKRVVTAWTSNTSCGALGGLGVAYEEDYVTICIYCKK